MDECIAQVYGSPNPIRTLRRLHRICQGIITHPQDSGARRLKTDIAEMPGASAFLLHIGFVQIPGQFVLPLDKSLAKLIAADTAITALCPDLQASSAAPASSRSHLPTSSRRPASRSPSSSSRQHQPLFQRGTSLRRPRSRPSSSPSSSSTRHQGASSSSSSSSSPSFWSSYVASIPSSSSPSSSSSSSASSASAALPPAAYQYQSWMQARDEEMALKLSKEFQHTAVQSDWKLAQEMTEIETELVRIEAADHALARAEEERERGVAVQNDMMFAQRMSEEELLQMEQADHALARQTDANENDIASAGEVERMRMEQADFALARQAEANERAAREVQDAAMAAEMQAAHADELPRSPLHDLFGHRHSGSPRSGRGRSGEREADPRPVFPFLPLPAHASPAGHVDLDNMSHDEIFELGERLGNVRSAGASESAISELPDSPFRVTGKEPTDCTICMETFEAGALIKSLPCFHHFHTDCIDQWLRRKATCPICKHPTTTT